MINLSEALNAVCQVFCEMPDGTGVRGIGVFIGPGTVATAWHVLEGAKDVRFVGFDGNSAKLKRGGRHLRDADIDVAISELSAPIGQEFCFPVTPGGAAERQTSGYLLTRFDGVARSSSIKMDGKRLSSPQVSFSTDLRTVDGYSGSPIVAESGHLISVVTAYDVAGRRRDDVAALSGGQTFHCLGPDPFLLAVFAEKYLFPERYR